MLFSISPNNLNGLLRTCMPCFVLPSLFPPFPKADIHRADSLHWRQYSLVCQGDWRVAHPGYAFSGQARCKLVVLFPLLCLPFVYVWQPLTSALGQHWASQQALPSSLYNFSSFPSSQGRRFSYFELLSSFKQMRWTGKLDWLYALTEILQVWDVLKDHFWLSKDNIDIYFISIVTYFNPMPLEHVQF